MLKEIARLNEMEKRRADLENLLKDLRGYYCEGGGISFSFKFKSSGVYGRGAERHSEDVELFDFDKDFMEDYLKKERDYLETQLEKLSGDIAKSYVIDRPENIVSEEEYEKRNDNIALLKEQNADSNYSDVGAERESKPTKDIMDIIFDEKGNER